MCPASAKSSSKLTSKSRVKTKKKEDQEKEEDTPSSKQDDIPPMLVQEFDERHRKFYHQLEELANEIYQLIVENEELKKVTTRWKETQRKQLQAKMETLKRDFLMTLANFITTGYSYTRKVEDHEGKIVLHDTIFIPYSLVVLMSKAQVQVIDVFDHVYFPDHDRIVQALNLKMDLKETIKQELEVENVNKGRKITLKVVYRTS